MPLGIDLTTSGLGFIIVTFTIGLLLGIVFKRIFKLAIAIISLVAVLVLTGYVNLSLTEENKQTIYHAALTALPTVVSTTSQVATLLPLTSTAFLAGIGIGLWKG